MLNMPIPFDEQLLNGATRRMVDDHLWNMAKRETSGAGSDSPLDVLRHIDPGKGTDLVEVGAAHGEVARARVAVPFDVELEAVGKHAFVGLDGREGGRILPPDPHIAAEDGAGRGAREGRDHASQPIGMSQAVRIYETEQVAGC